MLVVERSTAHCSVHLEGWPSDVIARAQRNLSPQKLCDVLLRMTSRMAGLVDRSDEVTLIVAADFAAAVRARLQTDEHLAADQREWTDDPNCAGCTLAPSEDGKISVVIKGTWIADLIAETRSLTVEEDIDLDLLVVHEAQHVLQFQRGSWGGSNDIEENADHFFTLLEDVAAKMCDEYGACWHEVRITGLSFDPAEHAMLILDNLGNELDRVCQQYGGSSDFGRLCMLVVESCTKLWMGITYWSAIYSAVDEPIPDELVDDVLWRRYVDKTWGCVFAILQTLPVTDLMVDPDEFDSVVKHLVIALQASLGTVGNSLAPRLARLPSTRLALRRGQDHGESRPWS
jgi:hypothetical protein